MSRFYLRLALIPIALFTLVLILIHAQPYDDHELRELLLPEGCPAPCFMGIRPGVTTMDEAMKILKANKWVAQIEKESVMFDNDIITWTWSDQKPKWISPSSQGQLWAMQNSKKPFVDIITIYSSLQLGEILSVLGPPDTQMISLGTEPNSIYAYYMAFYDKGKLSLQALQSCNTREPFIALIDLRLGVPLSSPYSIPILSPSNIFRACRK